MNGYLHCKECGLDISWAALEHDFETIQRLHAEEHEEILNKRKKAYIDLQPTLFD